MPSTACLNGNHAWCKGCDCGCHNPEPTLFDDLPARPYTQEERKSAGWSGTDTSRDAEPIRAESQRSVIAYVTSQGHAGATVKEVRESTDLHHGTVASGALSVLHKKDHLARLLDKRDGCRVYVHPDYLNGRDHD